MEGKTVIVTGCTAGIGKATARDLAKRQCRLIMACRNVEAANKFKEELIQETGNTNIIAHRLDLSSFKSIREFASIINDEESRLDVLIHNAGTAGPFKDKTTEDGLEMTMGTNHYGPFLLTHLLIDLLKHSAPSRIVIVASTLYQYASLDLDNLNPVDNCSDWGLYNLSKCANVVWCLELARRLEGTGVTANCLHPGVVGTELMRNANTLVLKFWRYMIKTFFKSPEQGAKTSIYLATSPEVEGVSGKYFVDCKETMLKEFVQDQEKAEKFWELSLKLVQLGETYPEI